MQTLASAPRILVDCSDVILIKVLSGWQIKINKKEPKKKENKQTNKQKRQKK